MSFEEELTLVFISAIVAAVFSVVSAIINFWLNYKTNKSKNKADLRERLIDNFSAYLGKIQYCYFSVINGDFKLYSEQASEVTEYGYRVKFELNQSKYKDVLERIDEANRICATPADLLSDKIKLNDLYNLFYTILSETDTKRKKLGDKRRIV